MASFYWIEVWVVTCEIKKDKSKIRYLVVNWILPKLSFSSAGIYLSVKKFAVKPSRQLFTLGYLVGLGLWNKLLFPANMAGLQCDSSCRYCLHCVRDFINNTGRQVLPWHGSLCTARTAVTAIAAVNAVVNASQTAFGKPAQAPVKILPQQHKVWADAKLGRSDLCFALQCSSQASHSTQAALAEIWIDYRLFTSRYSTLLLRIVVHNDGL